MALFENIKSLNKKEGLNEVTNRFNTCRIKDTSQDTDMWFNELYNLTLKLNKTKGKNEEDEDDMKAHVFDVLPE